MSKLDDLCNLTCTIYMILLSVLFSILVIGLISCFVGLMLKKAVS
jgi:hypothetical protein